MARRVRDLGGDPDLVKPDPDGRWHTMEEGRPLHDRDRDEEHGEGEDLVEFTGNISAMVYDRFGDLIGFRLDTEDGDCHFHSRGHEVEGLVQRAWAEHILITVLAKHQDPDRPMTLVLCGAVTPFEA